ncbi:hypothetical protein CapIbe_021116 [Capra ibex]
MAPAADVLERKGPGHMETASAPVHGPEPPSRALRASLSLGCEASRQERRQPPALPPSLQLQVHWTEATFTAPFNSEGSTAPLSPHPPGPGQAQGQPKREPACPPGPVCATSTTSSIPTSAVCGEQRSDRLSWSDTRLH